MNAQTDPSQPPQPAGVTEASEPEQADPARSTTAPTETEEPAKQTAESTGNAPPPHAWLGLIQTRRDFFLQIAVVAIGVLLALGLEQTVEAVHHAQQRAQLEEQLRETFEALDISDDVQAMNDFRAYLTDVQAAVAARLNGRSAPPPPAATDPRNYALARTPNMGPYEAAKANGSVAILSIDRIRIYNQIEMQYRTTERQFLHFFDALTALRAFRARFDSSPAIPYAVMVPDLAMLSTAQLIEYQALLATTEEAARVLASSLRRLDRMSQVVLDGAHDVSEVMEAAHPDARDNRENAPAPPAGDESGATNAGGSHD